MSRPRAVRPALTQRLGIVARRLGLVGPAYRVMERYRGFRAGRGPRVADDGLPLPPPYLRVLVAGHADPGTFLREGRLGAHVLGDAVRRSAGTELSELRTMIDFGCGCGRVARHWGTLGGPEVHGCDYNARLACPGGAVMNGDQDFYVVRRVD